MSAESIAHALGGRRCGLGWTARCPAHQDRTPSLSVRDVDGRVLVHCHAGCPQDAVIAALREHGLWPERPWQCWTPAERRAWARERRAEERDLSAARWFARAATALAEAVLEGLEPWHDERTGLTQLLQAVRAAPLIEYRAWQRNHPKLTDAMVASGRASDEGMQRRIALFVMSFAGGGHAAA